MSEVKIVVSTKFVVGCLDTPEHPFRRQYLHFTVWSGTRNLDTEIRVFQACGCGEEHFVMGRGRLATCFVGLCAMGDG